MTDSDRLSQLRINGGHRRFLVARMGSTGSSWLAKLLNSHPAVYCSHEGVLARVYPATEYTSNDIVEFIEYLAWDDKHNAYEAVGDVGSVWTNHIASLPSFSTRLLVRHPARVLNTRLAVYPTDQSFTVVSPETQKGIGETFGIDYAALEPIDQIFLGDVYIYATQALWLDKGVSMVRVEDLRDPKYCRGALKSLTGLLYDEALIEYAIQTPVNQRSVQETRISEILTRFTPRQREWYRVLLADVATRFRYDLMDGL